MIPPEKVFEENLSCPVCFDIMSNPTTTICGHNFCYDCIIRSNLGCAICRRKLSQDQITLNFQLKELITSYKSFKIELEKQRFQTQKQLEENVVPVFFNTCNIFNNNQKRLSYTSNLTNNNVLVLKNRGNKSKRNHSLFLNELDTSCISYKDFYNSSTELNISNYANQENIYGRIDVMMDDFELLKPMLSNKINTNNNSLTDNNYNININFFNNNRKKFKYN